MNFVIPGLAPDKVIRRVEETRELSKYSLLALENMYHYQVGKRARLERHYCNLNVFLNHEPDLYYQMGLAQRMTKVERNTEITEDRIKRLRAEILSRRIATKRNST